MSRNRAFVVALGALILFLLTPAGQAATGRRLTRDQVRRLAEAAAARFPNVDPLMLRGIAQIESAGFVRAFRLEPGINDASAGLMQTLLGTAQWMWDSGFHVTAQRPERFELLFDPAVSMGYAAAYLNFLRTWGGISRGEEWIVRAYNGGPGNAESAATAPYYQRYLAAKNELGG